MAVSNTNSPNLSPSYENILGQLTNRANMEANRTNVAGVAGGVLNKQADLANERSMYAFKSSIEDQLNKNKSEYQARAEGKTLYTQDDVNTDLAREHPDLKPEFYPNVSKKGILATPEQYAALGDHGARAGAVEQMASQVEADGSKTGILKGQAIRAFGMQPNSDQILARVASLSALKEGTDQYQRKYYYDPTNPMDRIYAPTAPPVTDESQVTPKMAEPINKEQTGLAKDLAPINKQLAGISEARNIIEDPKSKAIEQNTALLRYARAAAGSVRNWKEVAVVSGNPDIESRFERLINSNVDGSSLAPEDKQSLMHVLQYDETSANKQKAQLKSSAVERAKSNSPLVPGDIVQKRVLAGTEDNQPSTGTAVNQPPGTIKVTRKSDGQPGYIDPRKFDPSKYDVAQ